MIWPAAQGNVEQKGKGLEHVQEMLGLCDQKWGPNWYATKIQKEAAWKMSSK